jgi:hypothetical protein
MQGAARQRERFEQSSVVILCHLSKEIWAETLIENG